jgi:hypothetical protein
MSTLRHLVEDMVEASMLAVFLGAIACLARAWMGA